MKIEKLNTLDSHKGIEANLLEDFHDPDFREVYADEFLNAKIATQIKVLREQRGMTQAQLAELAEMKQERISVLEDVNYESWTLNVLRRLAKAFDLRISVEFKDFGSFFEEFATFGRKTLERKSFNEDGVFKKPTRPFRVVRKTEAVTTGAAAAQLRFPFFSLIQGNSQPRSTTSGLDESVKTGNKQTDDRFPHQRAIETQKHILLQGKVG